jgi:hypothetical protein
VTNQTTTQQQQVSTGSKQTIVQGAGQEVPATAQGVASASKQTVA